MRDKSAPADVVPIGLRF